MTTAETAAHIALPCRLRIDKEVFLALTLGQLLEFLLAGIGCVAGVDIGVVGISQGRVLRPELRVGLPQVRVTDRRPLDDLAKHRQGNRLDMLGNVLIDLVGKVGEAVTPSGLGVHLRRPQLYLVGG
ncbi:hypothetical protein D3C72_1506040 [compost metagenome]